jgi:hypothetical protein
MKQFTTKHTGKITRTIACFDRILFKGYLLLSWAECMERFISSKGVLLKDFKGFVMKQSGRVKQYGRAIALIAELTCIHLNGRIRKEEKARQITTDDGITEGLICVLSAVET